MHRTERGSPPLNGEGAAFRKATPSNSRSAKRYPDHRARYAPDQATDTEARACEGIGRRHALAAVALCGALALQEAALSTHYSRRAVSLFRRAGQ